MKEKAKKPRGGAMAIKLKPKERLVCVGQTALRAPDGTPLPAVPLYKIVDISEVEEHKKSEPNPPSVGESGLYEDIAAVFGEKFKAYVDGLEAAGIKL